MQTPIEDQIYVAIVEELKAIKTINGYWSNVLDSSIRRDHKRFTESAEFISDDSSSFPLIFVNTGRVVREKRMQMQKTAHLTFPLALYVRTPDDVSPDTALLQLIYDVERCLEAINAVCCAGGSTGAGTCPLGGLIANLNVTDVDTSEGFLAPLALAVMNIEIEFRYYPNEQIP